jgi:hypothetical protein
VGRVGIVPPVFPDMVRRFGAALQPLSQRDRAHLEVDPASSGSRLGARPVPLPAILAKLIAAEGRLRPPKPEDNRKMQAKLFPQAPNALNDSGKLAYFRAGGAKQPLQVRHRC